MADPQGFLKVTDRELPLDRPVSLRLLDFADVHAPLPLDAVMLGRQAGRCMDCGIPFCHRACPLGNICPDLHDLVWRGQWSDALERLHETNNFPEFTGRVCPALCEAACVLGMHQPAVTIRNIEMSIVDQGFDKALITPVIPPRLTGLTVAVVGSGPAGLACAQQLTRVGHTVAVYERSDRLGGLLRYGIPNFKLEKRHIDRRLAQMEAEGTRFRTGVTIGQDIGWDELRQRYDAVVVAIGSTTARDLPLPGRHLDGIEFAVPYLTQATRTVLGDTVEQPITAEGKHVVVIGGGDTGSDCVGTALRQGAASVTSLEIMPRPPAQRPDAQPWPTYPMIERISSSHEEGGIRLYSTTAVQFLTDEQGSAVKSLRIADVQPKPAGGFEPVAGSERDIPADLVLLAMGFTGPEAMHITKQLGLNATDRGTLARDANYAASLPGVFVAGDAGRGQSLIVWAIAEGRACAASVDLYLQNQTDLPTPIPAIARPIGL
ncbi:MAG: glutamate synthase subunit beta [Bifidobacteriaceae bacterium]|nr:glutamate synthase subunit beta [Bifidobacteriaceae bacterium]